MRAASPAGGKGPIRWLRVLGGVAVVVLLAVPCLIGVVLVAVGGSIQTRTSAVAEGRAPGTLTFESRPQRYVIALSARPDGLFDGLSRTERRARFRVRESDASQARCTVGHPGGSTSQVRGDRQAISETAGNVYATVGEFDGRRGTTTVSCRFDPPQDLLGTPTEAPLMVHAANTPLRRLTWGLFLGVFAFSALGTLLILWGTVWRAPRST